MRKINNKIRTKQQSTFLTQNENSLITRVEKKAESLNPQSESKNTLHQNSFQDLSQRILFLRPFSHFQVKPNLNEQLNEVVIQFKKLSKKNFNPLSKSYEQKFIDTNSRNSIKQFKGDLRQILKKSMANTKKQKKLTTKQISRSKTVQQSYDDVQNQSANNLIKESKSDKQKQKKTLDKFNNLLHGAGATFLENWNINLNPKKIKEMKFNQLLNLNSVNKNYKDQVYFYEEQCLNKINRKYNFGKQIGIFLRSTDKVINTQQMKDERNILQSSQNSKLLRSNHRRIKTLNIDKQRGLSSYFKCKKSRRELIKASIPAPIINAQVVG